MVACAYRRTYALSWFHAIYTEEATHGISTGPPQPLLQALPLDAVRSIDQARWLHLHPALLRRPPAQRQAGTRASRPQQEGSRTGARRPPRRRSPTALPRARGDRVRYVGRPLARRLHRQGQLEARLRDDAHLRHEGL